jgi:hypothetical protein
MIRCLKAYPKTYSYYGGLSAQQWNHGAIAGATCDFVRKGRKNPHIPQGRYSSFSLFLVSAHGSFFLVAE